MKLIMIYEINIILLTLELASLTSDPMNRIEYISEDENLLGSDSLPTGLYGHCLIRISNEEVMLTGGFNGTE